MKTFVIAEAGINHDGDLQRAKDLAYAAKEAGASAVKFQSYTTEKRTFKGSAIFDVLKRCELSFEEQSELIHYCDTIGIEFFSTPFDTEQLEFLINDRGLRRIKLASFDVTNTEFLKAVNKYGENKNINVILSTGMSNQKEIVDALHNLDQIKKVNLLHCVSSYPTPDNEVNLGAIHSLKKLSSFSLAHEDIGYSDHSTGVNIPALSVLCGAKIVEKHFILDKNGPGVDAPVSANPQELKSMVAAIKQYEDFLGDGSLKFSEVERAASEFRRTS